MDGTVPNAASADYREYGRPPLRVVVVHGGPGAPGEMKPVATELSAQYGVLEPFQTAQSVNGQVEELARMIKGRARPPVTLIGWSWGAWLSFITTAENPSLVEKLILISSGPFESKYAEEIMPRRLSRLSEADRKRAEGLYNYLQEHSDSEDNALLEEFGGLMSKADSYDPHFFKPKAIKRLK